MLTMHLNKNTSISTDALMNYRAIDIELYGTYCVCVCEGVCGVKYKYIKILANIVLKYLIYWNIHIYSQAR